MELKNGITDFYKEYLKLLLEAPTAICRGHETRELIDVHFNIKSPKDRLVYLPRRTYNLPFAITESMLLVSKINEAKYAGVFNKNVLQFAEMNFKVDETGEFKDIFYGSYGYRIAESIPKVIEKLKEDHSTRQAVLTIHRVEDSFANVKDIPCTIALQFLIRDNKLNLFVYMRSNDAIWGTPYDLFMFTVLQEVIANSLKIELGEYYHNATSLHIYKRHYKMAERILEDIENGDYESICLPINMDYETFAEEAKYFVDTAFKKVPAREVEDKSWMTKILTYAKYEDTTFATGQLKPFMEDFRRLQRKRV